LVLLAAVPGYATSLAAAIITFYASHQARYFILKRSVESSGSQDKTIDCNVGM